MQYLKQSSLLKQKDLINYYQFYSYIILIHIIMNSHASQLPPIKNLEELMQQSYKKNQSIINQLENKLKTYTTFNYRQAYKEARVKRSRNNQKIQKQQSNPLINHQVSQMLQKAFLSNFLLELQDPHKAKKKAMQLTEEMTGVKTDRKERLKKVSNTLYIIKHYIEKQNFKPTQEEMYLLKSLCQIKDTSEKSNLDLVLKRLYKLMNEVVDLNQTRLLCLIVMLIADICYHNKDYSRSFFFYSQAKLYSSYTETYEIKTQALINMGLIAMDVKLYNESLILLKKALQYAWKIKNTDNELQIYDYIGNIYYYRGQLNESQYYHKRFTQGQVQKNESAIKKLSHEMLVQTSIHLNAIEKKDLNTLFLEYIKLPIVSIQMIPSKSLQFNKTYKNYGQNGEQPRRKRKNEDFQIFKQLPTVIDQINRLLNEDIQFISQIPNPDFQSNFISVHKYGRKIKILQFQQTPQFHKFMRTKLPKSQSKTLQVDSFERRIQKALSVPENKQWWQQIRQKISKNKQLHVGQLRNRIFNSHQSYYKYPEQKKRSYSLKNQKIKESFNKTLINWIDSTK